MDIFSIASLVPERVAKSAVPMELLDAAKVNPEVFRPSARVMAMINLDNLFRQVQETGTTKDMLELQAVLNKMGGMEPKEPTGAAGNGSGFSITINIPGSEPLKVESKPEIGRAHV